jgi:hypothetical protein
VSNININFDLLEIGMVADIRDIGQQWLNRSMSEPIIAQLRIGDIELHRPAIDNVSPSGDPIEIVTERMEKNSIVGLAFGPRGGTLPAALHPVMRSVTVQCSEFS